MTRRRRRPRKRRTYHHPGRGLAFIPAPLLGLAGCWQLDRTGLIPDPGGTRPGDWKAAAFAAVALLALTVWPVLILAMASLCSSGPGMLVTRRMRARSRKRKADNARRLGQDPRRPAFPAWVIRVIHAADRNRCVFCPARAYLQVDHFLPWALGGLSSLANLMLLCEYHNRVKSDYWVDGDGYVHYHPWADANNPRLACLILARQQRRRLRPLRLLRAAWALG